MQQTRGWLQMLLAMLGAACSVIARGETLHRYTVQPDTDLSEIAVQACFAGRPPRSLRSATERAAPYLRDARVVASGTALKRDGRYLRLGGLADDACISYRVSLADAAGDDWRRSALAIRVQDAVITSPQLWFWRPRGLNAADDIELQVRLPAGMNVSAPWRLMNRTAESASYRIGATPYHWPARVAFGRFPVADVDVPGARLRVAAVGDISAAQRSKLNTWLRSAAANATLAYGSLPVSPVQALIMSVGEAREPVPFGRVERGGFPALQFFVDPSWPLEDFIGDWTATHELAHLLVPFISRKDAWLSEGLASYYQNVLMARGGHYTPRRAWQKLHEGFQRGIRNTQRGQSLSEAARDMHREGAYMRVYWSGAAIALTADFELRKRTGNQLTLDEALRRLGDCCLPSNRTWRAEEIMRRLDELTGQEVFVPLYEQYVASSRFPDVRRLYRPLGLSVRENTVDLNDEASHAGIRHAIMSTDLKPKGPPE